MTVVGDAAWVDDLDSRLRRLPAGDETLDLTIQQTITDGPDGPRQFHVTLANGRARASVGRTTTAGIYLTQSAETAAAIVAGDLSTVDAFITGRLQLGGDAAALVDAGDSLVAVAAMASAMSPASPPPHA